MSDALRIGLVSTVDSPVRRHGAASVETLVWLLSRDLTRLGHEVTVFGAHDSEPYGELVPSAPSDDWPSREWVNLCRAVSQAARFDVLHSHAYLWGIPLGQLCATPMIHTLHVMPYAGDVALWDVDPSARVAAISDSQWRGFPSVRPTAVVYNGIDLEQFTFQADPEDYVLYLGRFTEGKGAEDAIHVARELGLRILVAGLRNDYFEAHVAPLVDGRTVEYVGHVTAGERNRLFGGARAFVYPLRAPEPGPLVVLEAMMCGTPVASIGLGGTPDIAPEGVGGALAESLESMPAAVLRALEVDRSSVRRWAESRFTSEQMAAGYLEVYRQAVADQPRPRAAPS